MSTRLLRCLWCPRDLQLSTWGAWFASWLHRRWSNHLVLFDCVFACSCCAIDPSAFSLWHPSHVIIKGTDDAVHVARKMRRTMTSEHLTTKKRQLCQQSRPAQVLFELLNCCWSAISSDTERISPWAGFQGRSASTNIDLILLEISLMYWRTFHRRVICCWSLSSVRLLRT